MEREAARRRLVDGLDQRVLTLDAHNDGLATAEEFSWPQIIRMRKYVLSEDLRVDADGQSGSVRRVGHPAGPAPPASARGLIRHSRVGFFSPSGSTDRLVKLVWLEPGVGASSSPDTGATAPVHDRVEQGGPMAATETAGQSDNDRSTPEHPPPPPPADVGALSGEEYRYLLARSPIPMLVHDRSHLLEVNQAFATLLGYDLPEIMDLSVDQVVHPDDLAERDRETDALLTGAADAVTHPCRKLIRKDRTVVWVRIHKSAIRRGGRVTVLVFVDKAWTVDVLQGTHTTATPPQTAPVTAGQAASTDADTDRGGREQPGAGWRQGRGRGEARPDAIPPTGGGRFFGHSKYL